MSTETKTPAPAFHYAASGGCRVGSLEAMLHLRRDADPNLDQPIELPPEVVAARAAFLACDEMQRLERTRKVLADAERGLADLRNAVASDEAEFATNAAAGGHLPDVGAGSANIAAAEREVELARKVEIAAKLAADEAWKVANTAISAKLMATSVAERKELQAAILAALNPLLIRLAAAERYARHVATMPQRGGIIEQPAEYVSPLAPAAPASLIRRTEPGEVDSDPTFIRDRIPEAEASMA